MRTATLDQRRVELPRVDTVYDAGWHLSYFMSLADIVRKARRPRPAPSAPPAHLRAEACTASLSLLPTSRPSSLRAFDAE